jgi:hypothetical protein
MPSHRPRRALKRRRLYFKSRKYLGNSKYIIILYTPNKVVKFESTFAEKCFKMCKRYTSKWRVLRKTNVRIFLLFDKTTRLHTHVHSFYEQTNKENRNRLALLQTEKQNIFVAQNGGCAGRPPPNFPSLDFSSTVDCVKTSTLCNSNDLSGPLRESFRQIAHWLGGVDEPFVNWCVGGQQKSIGGIFSETETPPRDYLSHIDHLTSASCLRRKDKLTWDVSHRHGGRRHIKFFSTTPSESFSPARTNRYLRVCKTKLVKSEQQNLLIG